MATQRGNTRGGKPKTGPRAPGNAAEGGSGPQDAPQTRSVVGDTALVIDGTPYALGDLELDELCELEDHVGLPMDAISFGSAKVIKYVVYLIRRRGDAEYKLSDAGSIKIGSVETEVDDESAGARMMSVGDRPTRAG